MKRLLIASMALVITCALTAQTRSHTKIKVDTISGVRQVTIIRTEQARGNRGFLPPPPVMQHVCKECVKVYKKELKAYRKALEAYMKKAHTHRKQPYNTDKRPAADGDLQKNMQLTKQQSGK